MQFLAKIFLLIRKRLSLLFGFGLLSQPDRVSGGRTRFCLRSPAMPGR